MASGSKGQKGMKREPASPVDEVEAAMAEEEGAQKYPIMKMSDIEDDALEIISRVAAAPVVLAEDSTLAMASPSQGEASVLCPVKRSPSKSNKVTEALKKVKGEPASVGQPTGRGSKGESASVGQPAGNESRGSASVGQPTGRHLEKKSFS